MTFFNQDRIAILHDIVTRVDGYTVVDDLGSLDLFVDRLLEEGVPGEFIHLWDRNTDVPDATSDMCNAFLCTHNPGLTPRDFSALLYIGGPPPTGRTYAWGGTPIIAVVGARRFTKNRRVRDKPMRMVLLRGAPRRRFGANRGKREKVTREIQLPGDVDYEIDEQGHRVPRGSTHPDKWAATPMPLGQALGRAHRRIAQDETQVTNPCSEIDEHGDPIDAGFLRYPRTQKTQA